MSEITINTDLTGFVFGKQPNKEFTIVEVSASKSMGNVRSNQAILQRISDNTFWRATFYHNTYTKGTIMVAKLKQVVPNNFEWIEVI